MLLTIKRNLFELAIVVLLLLVSYAGHYYLSWHLITGGLTLHLLRAAWMLLMIGIGYFGLTRQNIKWIKYLWLIVNAVLFAALVFDRIMVIYYDHNLNIPSYSFTSPFPYLIACTLPNIVKKQLSKA